MKFTFTIAQASKICLFCLFSISFRDSTNNSYNFLPPPSSIKEIPKAKKAMVIGLDGLQLEQIALAKTPNLDKLHIRKGYTGGIKGTATQQATYSLPGWLTVLTGVWADKHKVRHSRAYYVYNSQSAKTIFWYLKQHNPKLQTASITTWPGIHNGMLDRATLALIDYKKLGKDAAMVYYARSVLQRHSPNFMFIHLDGVDEVGHKHGYSARYRQAIRRADAYLGKLMAAIESRAQTEDWLLIVTTDHGRERGNGGYNHGGQSIAEKTIFVAMNKTGDKKFNRKIVAKGDAYQRLYRSISATAIVPTILRHFGIPIQKQWQLESKPLID